MDGVTPSNGWYTEPVGGSKDHHLHRVHLRDTTIYAQWTAKARYHYRPTATTRPPPSLPCRSM